MMNESQATILVVDDKKVNRMILEKHLQNAGFTNIIHADNGEQALELADQYFPDVILLDIVMPRLDGFEVCKIIKQRERTKMIPVVMVTTLEDKQSKLRSIEAGADDILNKPVDSLELTARVRSLINVKQYYEQIQHLNWQLMESIKNAERIQRALLPTKFPEVPGIAFDAYYQPAEYVGGDYYNTFLLPSGDVCMYIADVTGHQFDAAMLTVFLKEVISNYSIQVSEREQAFVPAECLSVLERAFKREGFPDEIFITIGVAVYHADNQRLSYSSAGFAQAPIVYGGKEIRRLFCPGRLIMSFRFAGDENDTGLEEPFHTVETYLEEGEGIFFYTDGLTEQCDTQGQQPFGVVRIEEILGKVSNNNQQDVIAAVVGELQAFSGTDKFQDDIAMFTVFRSFIE